MSKALKHKLTLLKAMKQRVWVTAKEFDISNANLYLKQLRDDGICGAIWQGNHRIFCIISNKRAKEFLALCNERLY
ncbi:MAG: hypothetical protein LBQ18_05365 [Campylobacteraceae bacterium]|jgi:hypothetical protein|nr:hypothetical protein [Campylobacteraceae bacterium]